MANRLSRPLLDPAVEDLDLYAVMGAVTDPVRRAIVLRLAHEPGLACGQFELQVSKSAMTRHWKVLRETGLIHQEVDGTRHRNWLRRSDLDRRFPGLLELILEQPQTSARS